MHAHGVWTPGKQTRGASCWCQGSSRLTSFQVSQVIVEPAHTTVVYSSMVVDNATVLKDMSFSLYAPMSGRGCGQQSGLGKVMSGEVKQDVWYLV